MEALRSQSVTGIAASWAGNAAHRPKAIYGLPGLAMTASLIAILSLTALAALGAAAFAGHELASRRMRQEISESKTRAAELIELWRRDETLAGAFSISKSLETETRPAAVLAGVERCYYSPPDFDRITWVPRDIPTPFVGYAPAPGRHASAVINDAQFRYRRNLDMPKPSGVCRIFLTGASTAFGAGASSNATTIGGYLEEYLNPALRERGGRCEVVTAAACAWTSTHERILIENRLVEFEPDLVISLSGHNDVFWASKACNSLWHRGMQDDYFLGLMNATLAANAAPEFPYEVPGVDAPPTAEQVTERLMRNVTLGYQALALVGARYMFALQPAMGVSGKIRTAREQRAATIAASQPWFALIGQYYPEFRRALSALRGPNYDFVDMTTVFDDCGDDIDIFIDTAHFGDRGNDLIARSLCNHVLPVIALETVTSRP